MYIFYNSKTLKIMGMSTEENAMEFPCIETDEKPIDSECLVITKDLQITENKERELKPELFFEKEDEYSKKKKILRSNVELYYEEKKKFEKKMNEDKLKLNDIANFIIKYLPI